MRKMKRYRMGGAPIVAVSAPVWLALDVHDVLRSVGSSCAGCAPGAAVTERSAARRRGVPSLPRSRGHGEWNHAALLRSHAVVQWRIR